MMIAQMAVAQGDIGLLPSFELGIDFGSQSQSQSQPEKEKEPAQETKKHDQDVQKEKGKEIQQHQGPEIKTPEEAIQKRQCMTKLCYKWATKPEGNNEYQHLFRFKTGKQIEAMRYHFTSMAEEAEIDLAIVQIMCILYNRENNEKFKYTTYCVPPLFLLFAPILYSHHWWLYVLDVTNKKFYVLDSKNSEPRLGDRNKLNRFAYMDIVNPSHLGRKNFNVPVWGEDELQRFREEFVERILYDGDNYYRHQAIKASNTPARHPKPSTALQSPYTQMQSADLESGN
ncbi:hypothetical protein PIB30_104254 [Stylosanthes scabra]|uniref:Ubiquitin-like protease family profile domain-containing protein n=1 Tax=Stylosanthes scabra TaxID=79078 RepID=A0ABU6QZL8_9FABA|nr:hypothetical protein [Stylosanthes scabra]